MLTEAYMIAIKVSAHYQHRFPELDVMNLAIDVAMKNADMEVPDIATLQRFICRELFCRLCNETRRLQREMKYESRSHEYKQAGRREPLKFVKLSKMAQLLLKQLELCNDSSQWNCYQELRQRGWTWEMFQKYIAELRRKYVPT